MLMRETTQELVDRARDEWEALGLMSYTGDQPDMGQEEVEEIRRLIFDLAHELAVTVEERDRLRDAVGVAGADFLRVKDRIERGVYGEAASIAYDSWYRCAVAAPTDLDNTALAVRSPQPEDGYRALVENGFDDIRNLRG